MSSIRESVRGELSAFVVANRTYQVAQNLLAGRPADPVLQTRLAVAETERREASSILKAALSAHGHSFAALQAELKALSS